MNHYSEQLERTMTVAGMREMIEDLRAQGISPHCILVNPRDCAGLKDELNDHGTDPRQNVLGIIMGCVIYGHRDIKRGTARVVTGVPQ